MVEEPGRAAVEVDPGGHHELLRGGAANGVDLVQQHAPPEVQHLLRLYVRS